MLDDQCGRLSVFMALVYVFYFDKHTLGHDI
ncbi:MAG: hypothetical protein ACI8VY_000352, partial [Cellvibrionaceae bacterium]